MKDYIGSIYRKKGNRRLYLNIPPRVSSALGVPRLVATGIEDTPEGREQAMAILREVTQRWLAHRGMPEGARPRRAVVTLQEAFGMFLESHARHRSEKMQHQYRDAWRAVMRFGNETDPAGKLISRGEAQVSILEEILKSWLQSGEGITPGRQVSAVTRGIYLRVFLTFCAWAHDEGLLPVMPRRRQLKKMLPATTGKPIATYSDAEIERMVSYCKTSDSLAERRLGELIMILARTPLRLHEALQLKIDDVDVRLSVLRVDRKDGRQVEYVPLRTEDIELIQRIGTGRTGTVLGYHDTSDSRLRKTLYRVMDRSGVERQGRSFHEFKKTYITRLLSRLGREVSLMEIARLSRCGVQVIERHYAKIDPEEMRRRLGKLWDAS